jgi:signal transduction histidine kinase
LSEREQRASLLLVDDEPANLVALEAILGPLGQDLVLASSGRDALRRLLQQDFAAVLLDVRMPDIDGLEVAELIRGRPSTRTLPIIFLTAYTEAEHDLRDAYRLGAADFIFKPIAPDFLRAKVGVFVDLHRQQSRVSELLVEAKAASRAKSEFLRMAGHELRSPLGLINGYLSMLSEGMYGPPPSAWSTPLDLLVRKAQELTALVNDVLEASSLEGEPACGAASRFDAREAVLEARERASKRFSGQVAEVEVTLPPEPVWTYADASYVARILDDLLDNALSFSRRPAWARLIVAQGEQVIIQVEDRGVGIPIELWERIFDRFFRIDDPELRTRPGTGLGLYISRALARSSGGWLEVGSSEPGRGTRFVLTLPTAEAWVSEVEAIRQEH